MRLIWPVLAAAVLLVGAGPAAARQEPDRSGSPEIALGDAAYARFDNDAALAHYVEAVEADPADYEARWKAARSYADVGAALERTDEDRAKEMYEQSVAAARRSVELAPQSADTHFILAMAVGRVALFAGARTKLELSREVKREADRAIELVPDHDGAHYILGRWHYAIATLGWIQRTLAKVIYGGVPPEASLERAAEAFARAIEIDGTRPGYHLEYARTLIRLERYSDAREQLVLCLDLPRVYWEDPAYKREAAGMLADMRDRR